jgi:hypothetical protein
MIQAFSLIFNFFNKASPCGDMNKTKQPFYNLLQCFRVKVDLRKISKKKFENLTLENTKKLHYTA